MKTYFLYEKIFDQSALKKHGAVDIPIELSLGAEFTHEDKIYRVYQSDRCILVDDSRVRRINEKVMGQSNRSHDLNETQLKSIILNRLYKYFEIDLEVWGTHSTGKNLRIDAVLKPKNKKDWGKNSEAVFGIEFKNPLTRGYGSRRGRAAYFAQCFDYAFTHFKGYGNIPIFICPEFKASQDLKNVLAAYRIGHVDFAAKGISLSFGSGWLWSEETGVTTSGRSISFRRKYGVRN